MYIHKNIYVYLHIYFSLNWQHTHGSNIVFLFMYMRLYMYAPIVLLLHEHVATAGGALGQESGQSLQGFSGARPSDWHEATGR